VAMVTMYPHLNQWRMIFTRERISPRHPLSFHGFWWRAAAVLKGRDTGLSTEARVTVSEPCIDF
jgi:hypothetical protein